MKFYYQQLNSFFKRFFLLLLLLIICYNPIFAQLTETFRDDFSNNKSNWQVGSTATSSLSVQDGFLKMEHKRKNGWYLYFCDAHLNEKGNFFIETKIKQTAGITNDAFGMIWGAASWKDCYYFEIASGGWYRIYAYKNSKYQEIKKSSWDKKINPLGKFNVIALEKNGNNLNFYINGKVVYTMPATTPLGRYVGYSLGKQMTVVSDYLSIKQNKGDINLLSGLLSKYSKINMGAAINSANSEIAPVISPDGKTLFVARKKSSGNYNIWFSTKNAAGKWSKLQNIGKPLNNNQDNVVIAITPDNNTLMLEGLYNSDGSYLSDQGISVSYRNASGGWSVPVKIDIKNYYNLDQYESFSPTGDRQTIIMSVQRNGGYGQKDLYVSFRNNDGSYSVPKNMGAVLNSYDNEGTPYIAPDNKTLYFYSYTEPGYGNADIFVSKRLDDSWTNWSTPKNLGKKINTSDWDVYYTVDAKGEFAYLVSTKFAYGLDDIFTIKLNEEEKPDPVVLLHGKVLDKKTKRTIAANIVYEDASTGKIVGQASSNPQTGEYKIVLPYGKKYNIRATKKNYFATQESLNLLSVMKYKELKRDLYLAPMSKGKTILLKNVHFYAAKATLLPSSYPELNRLAAEMNENKKMKIEIQGHTENNAGYEDKLMLLSEQRAETVKKYIQLKGISSNRITTKAFGGTMPIGTNATEAGRKLNRRVEFRITHE